MNTATEQLSLTENSGKTQPAEIKQLAQKKNWPGIVQIIAHLSVIIITGSLVWQLKQSASPWLWPMLLIHGAGMVFLFCALHETIHRTAFASRRLNDAVSHLAGVVVMLGPEMFRAFHYAHHRYTQDPDRDPELSVKDITTWSGYLLYLSGLSYWWRALKGLLMTAAGKVDAPYVSAHKKPLIIREARLYLLFYLTLALISWWLQSTALLWLWLMPVVLAQPLMRAYLLAEHSGCEFSADMLANTRTTLTNPLVRFYAWNMPYHVEHHAYPGVPFHALAKVNRLIDGDIVYRSPGYIAFHRSWMRQLSRTAI